MTTTQQINAVKHRANIVKLLGGMGSLEEIVLESAHAKGVTLSKEEVKQIAAEIA